MNTSTTKQLNNNARDLATALDATDAALIAARADIYAGGYAEEYLALAQALVNIRKQMREVGKALSALL